MDKKNEQILVDKEILARKDKEISDLQRELENSNSMVASSEADESRVSSVPHCLSVRAQVCLSTKWFSLSLLISFPLSLSLFVSLTFTLSLRVSLSVFSPYLSASLHVSLCLCLSVSLYRSLSPFFSRCVFLTFYLRLSHLLYLSLPPSLCLSHLLFLPCSLCLSLFSLSMYLSFLLALFVSQIFVCFFKTNLFENGCLGLGKISCQSLKSLYLFEARPVSNLILFFCCSFTFT